MSEDTNEIDWTRFVAVGGVAVVLLSLLLLPSVASTAAASTAANDGTTQSIEEKAPYYTNESTETGMDSWMDGRTDPTLDNVTHYITRVGGFIIGSGHSAQGGAGAAGSMIFGLVVFGAFVGTTVGTRVGPVGGATVAMVTAAGLTSVGLVPQWIYAVALFALGLVVLKVFTTVLE